MYWQPAIETMARSDLTQLQTRRLQQQLERAAAAPFYQRLWHGKPAHLRDLPFLQKHDLIAAQLRDPPVGDLPLSPKEQWREVYPVQVAGGSLYTVYADADLTRSSEVGARILYGAGLRPGDVLHNGFPYGLFAGGIFIHRAAKHLGATVVPIGTDSVQRQVEFLFNFKPAMLVGAPSHVLYLAERILERGLLPRDIGLKAGLFGA
ncbi:MAG TPA: hypothetical protein VK464_06880, partial [Symbiobacteriaceae bacterium]|nr:hypothetical protein [Symbiobacteriaceae bacterium]